jgi:uncharacterized membrane protein
MITKLHLHLLWIPLFLALAISGALTENIWPLYLLVISICFCIGLIAFDKIPRRLYLPILFSMSLSLLYQTTLMSPGVVGTDVHGDYYYSYWTLTTGTWHWQYPEAYNTSISTTLFAPFISWAFHIPLEWVFKTIYPFLLSLVPPILYLLYKEHIDQKLAFLSCFFMVSVPTYLIELTGIPKQQVAEFFFVVVIFLLLSKAFRLKWKPLWIGLAALLFVLCHYSIFAIGTIYLAGATALLVGARLLWHKIDLGVNLKWLIPVTAVVIITGGVYYSTVAEGRVWNSFSGTYSTISQKLNPSDTTTTTTVIPIVTPSPVPIASPTPEPTVTVTPVPTYHTDKTFYLQRQGPIVKAALGLDFFDVSTTGKIFRILQFATEALIILGLFRILTTKGKGWSKAYLAFGLMGCVILALTVFYPAFSPIMNATRFYQLSLIFLAPAVVIGGMWLFRRIGGIKTLTLGLLIPYFIFTSGFIFEATHNTTIEVLDTPYSIALSGNRVEVGGIMTENDMKVRDYIVYHNYFPVTTDIYGTYLVLEKSVLRTSDQITEFWVDLLKPVQDDSYIFLRERNTEKQELTFWLGVGQRTTRTYSQLDFSKKILEGRSIIYQCGNAILYSPK